VATFTLEPETMMWMWISPDPKRQFASLYSYTGNGFNPINGVDPDGKQVVESAALITFFSTFFVARNLNTDGYDATTIALSPTTGASLVQGLLDIQDNGVANFALNKMADVGALRLTKGMQDYNQIANILAGAAYDGLKDQIIPKDFGGKALSGPGNPNKMFQPDATSQPIKTPPKPLFE